MRSACRSDRRYPTWSPDSEWLAFGRATQARTRGAAGELWMVQKNGQNPVRLDLALGDALLRDGMEGLVTFQGGLSLANRQLIVDFAAAHRRPAIYQSEFFIAAGGLMAWAPDLEEQYREAARYVDRILKGAKPGDLPARYPGHYALSLNMRVASTLDLTLPASLVAQAERVVR